MSSLDHLFIKEFLQTMKARASAQPLNLFKIGIPILSKEGNKVAKTDKVVIRGISDEYYKALNGTENLLWSRPKLRKRRYGAQGKFLTDDNGKIITDEVTLPRNCVAIISQVKLGVPTKYTPSEDFKYVDYVTDKATKEISYVYTVPKRYCFKLNQTALVLSTKSLRSYYEGMSVYLKSGHLVYLYVVPYKPTQEQKTYRPLIAKTSVDYSKEINVLLSAWIRHNIAFHKSLTELSEPVKERTNVAYKLFGSVLDDYEKYDINKSLADIQTEAHDIMH